LVVTKNSYQLIVGDGIREVPVISSVFLHIADDPNPHQVPRPVTEDPTMRPLGFDKFQLYDVRRRQVHAGNAATR
jgi:hypothetical protein